MSSSASLWTGPFAADEARIADVAGVVFLLRCENTAWTSRQRRTTFTNVVNKLGAL
jgi:hypothetical protein